MQNPQQVWQGLAAELGAIDIAMQGAYKVFSCMDEEEVKVRTLLSEMYLEEPVFHRVLSAGCLRDHPAPQASQKP